MLTATGLLDRIDFNLVPWGNAYYNISACGGPTYDKAHMYCWAKECGVASPPSDCYEGAPLCQHGEDECVADTLEACAMDLYPAPKAYMPFVTCFEKQETDGAKRKPCIWLPRSQHQ